MNKAKVISSVIAVSSATLIAIPVSSYAGTAPNKNHAAAVASVVASPSAPPVGFNPLSATSAELSKYGFPQRPSDSAKVSAWENAMEHAKTYVQPIQTPSTYTHGVVSTGYSSLWAGYVVQSSNNSSVKYNNASANWTQPSYSGSADPSFWVGMDGYTSNDVVQAGADSDATNAGGGSHYEFWVEDYPLGTVWEASPAVSAGDSLYVDVTYNGSTSSAFLEDLTKNTYTTVNFSTPYYTGDSADYIYEAVGGIYSNWGSTGFGSCDLQYKTSSGGSGSGVFGAYNDTKVIMTNTGTSSGTVEGSPGPIYSSLDGFTVTSY